MESYVSLQASITTLRLDNHLKFQLQRYFSSLPFSHYGFLREITSAVCSQQWEQLKALFTI